MVISQEDFFLLGRNVYFPADVSILLHNAVCYSV